jgi:acetyl esterase/lipase
MVSFSAYKKKASSPRNGCIGHSLPRPAPRRGIAHGGRPSARSTGGHPGRLEPMVAAWCFLALSLIFLMLTLNSFWPVRNNRLLFVPSFAFSWMTNELASIYLGCMLVIIAGFVAFGHVLDYLIGWIALAIMAVVWVLVAVLHAWGRRAANVVTTSLGEFGKDQRFRKPSRRRYRLVRNVEYQRVAGKKIRLDITLPVDVGPGDLRPAILQIHGGGWVIGDKRQQAKPLLHRLASNGWVCFNANYRLSPGATWPEHLIDCKRALAWIREHAAEYGVDPSFVAVTGGSAGGHLSALMGLTVDDKTLQPGFEDADCSVQAAVPFYGIYDFTNRLATQPPEMRKFMLEPMVMKAFYEDEPEKFQAASPVDRVHAGAPPFFVVHGDKDTLAPVEDARYFVEQLASVSHDVVFYAEIPGAQHAFELFSSPRTRRTLDGVQRFLYECYDRHTASAVVSRRAPSPATVR